jgi:DNA-binding MarR family transcriptional regulator
VSEPLRTHIHQTKDFASLEEEVYIGLCLVSQMIERPWNRYLLATADLSTGQYNMLRILRGAGTEGLTVGSVSLRMINRDPDIATMMEHLILKRLVASKRTSTDRSLAKLAITQDGLKLLDTLDEEARSMPPRMLGHLPEERLKQLDDLLGTVLEGELHFP